MTETMPRVELEVEMVMSSTGSGWHFLIFHKDEVEELEFEDKFRRVVCTMNGALHESFQCALMPWEDKLYIIVNKGRRERLGIAAGDMVHVSLVRDESKYGLPMPEEFQAVLDQDPEGDTLFHALGKGKQRSILYLLSKPKDIDVRIHQGLVVLRHLKENDGVIIDKKLSQEIKRPAF